MIAYLLPALDLTPLLPSALSVLKQWVAEPTRYIFLPASAFIANAKGYPVLPKGTQSFITDIMKASQCTMFATHSDVHIGCTDPACCHTIWHRHGKAQQRGRRCLLPICAPSRKDKSGCESHEDGGNRRKLCARVPRLFAGTVAGM